MTSGKNAIIFFIFIIVGALIGTGIGEFLTTIQGIENIASFLVTKYLIVSVPPVTINLIVLTLIVGFSFQPSIMTMLGIVLGIFLYKRFH